LECTLVIIKCVPERWPELARLEVPKFLVDFARAPLPLADVLSAVSTPYVKPAQTFFSKAWLLLEEA
jgi:hypothetical protein